MYRQISSPIAFLVIIVLCFVLGAYWYLQKPGDLRQAAAQEGIDDLTDIKMAKLALTRYFEYLGGEDYDKAVKYHGSGYQELSTLYPSYEKNEYAEYLRRACEDRVFKCMKIKNIVSEKAISDSNFSFIVQFTDTNGKPYKKGEEFNYIVKKIGWFQVLYRVMNPVVHE